MAGIVRLEGRAGKTPEWTLNAEGRDEWAP
jgi:hypothetical protein